MKYGFTSLQCKLYKHPFITGNLFRFGLNTLLFKGILGRNEHIRIQRLGDTT